MGRLTVHLQPEQNCILDGKLEKRKKTFLQILYLTTLIVSQCQLLYAEAKHYSSIYTTVSNLQDSRVKYAMQCSGLVVGFKSCNQRVAGLNLLLATALQPCTSCSPLK